MTGLNTAPSTVVRSAVGTATTYREYQEPLRVDFWFSCAYCTITEIELGGRSFGIDHYEPQLLRPDLSVSYDNLMWCCVECNSYKGHISPTLAMRAAGKRFFHADTDDFLDHYRLNGLRVEGTTPVGEFTADLLDLNRLSLQRVRSTRERLYASTAALLGGLRQLATLQIDLLPEAARTQLKQLQQELGLDAGELNSSLADLVRTASRSKVLDEDPEAPSRTAKRRQLMKDLKALHPEFMAKPVPVSARD